MTRKQSLESEINHVEVLLSLSARAANETTGSIQDLFQSQIVKLADRLNNLKTELKSLKPKGKRHVKSTKTRRKG